MNNTKTTLKLKIWPYTNSVRVSHTWRLIYVMCNSSTLWEISNNVEKNNLNICEIGELENTSDTVFKIETQSRY